MHVLSWLHPLRVVDITSSQVLTLQDPLTKIQTPSVPKEALQTSYV